MSTNPAAVPNLVTRQAGDEVVVLCGSVSHLLSKAEAAVLRVCDGHRGADDLARATGLGTEQVAVLVEQLRQRGLVGRGTSRRALLGGSALTVTAGLVGMALPVAAAAASMPTSGPVAPTITSVAPDAGPAAGGTLVTLMGTGFTSDLVVTFGGSAAGGVSVLSPSRATAYAPAYNAGAGSVDVVVTSAGGSATLTRGYTYVAAPPP